jgi:hypothetical protein
MEDGSRMMLGSVCHRAADEIERLTRERDERAQWAETWHRGLEAVATVLDVSSCGGHPMVVRDICAAIERLRQRVVETAAPRPTAFACWERLDEMIKHRSGHLSGTGCDPTAERNGLILAANTLHLMIFGDPRRVPVGTPGLQDSAEGKHP